MFCWSFHFHMCVRLDGCLLAVRISLEAMMMMMMMMQVAVLANRG